MPSSVSEADFGEQPDHAPLLQDELITQDEPDHLDEESNKRRCGWGWWLLLGVLGVVVAVAVPTGIAMAIKAGLQESPQIEFLAPATPASGVSPKGGAASAVPASGGGGSVPGGGAASAVPATGGGTESLAPATPASGASPKGDAASAVPAAGGGGSSTSSGGDSRCSITSGGTTCSSGGGSSVPSSGGGDPAGAPPASTPTSAAATPVVAPPAVPQWTTPSGRPTLLQKNEWFIFSGGSWPRLISVRVRGQRDGKNVVGKVVNFTKWGVYVVHFYEYSAGGTGEAAGKRARFPFADNESLDSEKLDSQVFIVGEPTVMGDCTAPTPSPAEASAVATTPSPAKTSAMAPKVPAKEENLRVEGENPPTEPKTPGVKKESPEAQTIRRCNGVKQVDVEDSERPWCHEKILREEEPGEIVEDFVAHEVRKEAVKVYSIADLHGDYIAAIKSLQLAGLLGDDQRTWTGGRNVLVQTGDVVDRGENSREIYELLFHLQDEAEKVGGQVILLLGNHELMRLVGDTSLKGKNETNWKRSEIIDYATVPGAFLQPGEAGPHDIFRAARGPKLPFVNFELLSECPRDFNCPGGDEGPDSTYGSGERGVQGGMAQGR